MKATTKAILSAWRLLDSRGATELPVDPEIYSARSLAKAAESCRGRCELEASLDGRTLAISIHPELRHQTRQITGELLNLLLECALKERLDG